MKQQMNYPYKQYYVETSQYLPKRTSLFNSSAGKIESVQEFKIKLLE